jgi:hypothetical protein
MPIPKRNGSACIVCKTELFAPASVEAGLCVGCREKQAARNFPEHTTATKTGHMSPGIKGATDAE